MKLSDPTKNQNVASLRKRLKLLKLSLKTKLKWLVRDKRQKALVQRFRRHSIVLRS